MSVYLDNLVHWNWMIRGRRVMSCHLIADSKEELIHFATKNLAMKESWYQPKSTPHFDLTKSRRDVAILHGAIPLQRREFVQKLREIQQKVKDGEWQ
jgi:hypothetical protein